MKKSILFACLLWGLGFAYGFTGISTSYESTDVEKYRKHYGFNNSITNDSLIIIKENLFALVVLIAGGLVFSAPTVYLLLVNGYGIALNVASLFKMRLGFSKIFLLFFPHSIEFIGIWIAGGVGFQITKSVFDLLNQKAPDYESIKRLIFFSAISTLIIIIAAFLESSISFKIVP
jgi:uncharacterized membrane protein SpoIIM required for sporulation